MASIRPFAALRPRSDLATRICELPYDVMSSEEARTLARGNPLSFLKVSKPEIDLPADTDPCSPAVYAKGAENFTRLVRDGSLVQDSEPCFYLYRQVMGRHSQTGIVATASCQEYLDGIIKKHELTRPDKEDDRVRHIEALNAQTGPVFLTYRAAATVDSWIAQRTSGPPEVDFTAADGVSHSAWVVNDATSIRQLEKAFGAIPALYIADGHHRSAAAARVFQARRGAGESARFLAVIFPHNQMQILPYNRVLRDLHSQTRARLLERLGGVFDFLQTATPRPGSQHHVSFYIDRRWHTLVFKPPPSRPTDPIELLDVSQLQQQVLAPIFGIDDPRTSKRINFVGGIRGPVELERLVDGGEYACAFSMFPTGIEELMAIADAGGIMPPKSTWFEPKLRDAMFCHLI